MGEAATLNNLGALYQEMNEYDKALALLQQALEVKQRILPGAHPEIATSLYNLAELYRDQQKHAEAEPLYRQSLEIYEKQLGEAHPNAANVRKRLSEWQKPAAMPVVTQMKLIPAGTFQMGSDVGDADERPVHTVYVDAFYIDVHEVTNAQYRQFIEATDHRKPKYWAKSNLNGDNQPVVGVSWYDAMAYAKWAGKRLPTEAEWEKAARGGLEGKRYPWGDSLESSQASHMYKNLGKPMPVGSYPANGYGLYDMAGNVWEWCLDEYQMDFYRRNPTENPLAGSALNEILENFHDVKTARVLRGGSWHTAPFGMRVANREPRAPASISDPTDNNGFRCVSERLP
jgi:formylglycine-generating enzyme